MPNRQGTYVQRQVARGQVVWNQHRLCVTFGVIYLVLSLFAMTHFLNASFLGDRYFKTTFDGMYEGTTFKPFVYRQLVPTMARTVTAVSPDILKNWVNEGMEVVRKDPSYEEWRTALPFLGKAFPSPGKHYQRIVTIFILYGFLWGYILALKSLARQVFPISPAMEYMAPVFGILLISGFSFPFQYVYDIPVLFFATAGYYFIACRRWLPYLAIFLFGCINKETMIFLFLFSAIWLYPRLERKTFVNLMLAQYVIFALVRITLLYIYNDNTGEYLKNHLFRVLPGDVLATSQYLRIVHIGMLFFLLTFQWAKKPAFLKAGLWLLPPMYGAYLLYGMPGEYRVFFDVLPLPLLLCVHTLVEGTGVARSPFFTHSSQATTNSTGMYHDSSD